MIQQNRHGIFVNILTLKILQLCLLEQGCDSRAFEPFKNFLIAQNAAFQKKSLNVIDTGEQCDRPNKIAGEN